jgi:hypothetical protein
MCRFLPKTPAPHQSTPALGAHRSPHPPRPPPLQACPFWDAPCGALRTNAPSGRRRAPARVRARRGPRLRPLPGAPPPRPPRARIAARGHAVSGRFGSSPDLLLKGKASLLSATPPKASAAPRLSIHLRCGSDGSRAALTPVARCGSNESRGRHPLAEGTPPISSTARTTHCGGVHFGVNIKGVPHQC